MTEKTDETDEGRAALDAFIDELEFLRLRVAAAGLQFACAISDASCESGGVLIATTGANPREAHYRFSRLIGWLVLKSLNGASAVDSDAAA